jgi:N-acetylmuramoyl-L-alanine amidase
MTRRGRRDQEYSDADEAWDNAVESAAGSDSEIPRPSVDLPRPENPAASLIRGWALSCLSNSFLAFSIGAGVTLVLMFMLILQRPADLISAALPTLATVLPLRATRTPTVTPTPQPPPIAILAGHSGGIDPGAICPDGLREVDVTTDVAKRAKGILEASGYRVDILAEFDARLNVVKRDYAPRAFLAIHADSCVYYASGYKVARASSSASPLEDDRLVRCVSTAYAAATLLPFHAGSITSDMTQYHGLNEINPLTPGAIIELGFLGSQHDLLKNRRAMLADAIASGLDNFLRGDPCKKAEASGQ